MTTASTVRALHPWMLALALACLASACDREAPADAAANGEAGMANLPSPEAGAGSVTGMPGARADARASAADAATDATTDPFDLPGFDGDGDGIPDDATVAPPPGDPSANPGAIDNLPPQEPADPLPPTPVDDAGGPGADEAAAVVRSYYGAIDARQYEQAYQLWSGDGRSSGQSAASFAGGFGDTAGVSVQTGAPGRVEGAAGSRYVRVPVSIRAVGVDGSERRYEGSYTLRRSVVDGATAAQREWRIESADLREVQ